MYFVIAFILSLFIQKIIKSIFPEKAQVSKFELMIKILMAISIIVVVSYFLRNFVQTIPFPLDGIEGFDHHRVKELGGGMLTTLLFLFNYQIFLEAKQLFIQVDGPFEKVLL
jgi:hypothetical protein